MRRAYSLRMSNTNPAAALEVGSTFTTGAAFTAPTGASFAPGQVFTVNLIGAVNVRCHAKGCNTIVWFSRGQLRDAGFNA